MNDVFLFIKDNWVSITGTIGVVIAWFFDKKNRKEETKIKQGSAMETMQAAYDKFVDDAQKQYNLMDAKITTLEDRERVAIAERAKLEENINPLKKQVSSDKKEMEQLQKRITEYEVKIKYYEEQVKSLTNELSKYKNP